VRVAVAGASGFVGRALVGEIAARHDVVALGRGGGGGSDDGLRVTHRRCDLFSLLDAERALVGIDVAFYLVHSMMPSARLTQGGFEDMDLVCADNFARAAEKCGVRRIIYLGGIMPAGPEEDLSPHLRSRLEVERTLASRSVPVTTLRAGLILGAGGSSFRMLLRLVERLPAMILPRWTASRCRPIALEDVVALLTRCLEDPTTQGRAPGDPRSVAPPTGSVAYDVGGPDVLTYREMLERTARALGRRRLFLSVPLFSPRLSLLWVSVVTGASSELVRPLVESLRHDMVGGDGLELQRRCGLPGKSFDDALGSALAAERARPPAPNRSTVRSVQRLPLPPDMDAQGVATEYALWLPRVFRTLIRVDVDDARCCRFRLLGLRRPLLELSFSSERSAPDRQLFYITGGLLARLDGARRGRLEFRIVLEGRHVIAAIHDFVPTLPWFVYNLTQAIVHVVVMNAFGRYLAALAAERREAKAAGAPITGGPVSTGRTIATLLAILGAWLLLTIAAPEAWTARAGDDSPRESAAAPPLEVGFGRRSLRTDIAGISLGGYGGKGLLPSLGVHDDVQVKAMVVRTPERTVGFVTADLVGVQRQIRDALARRPLPKEARLSLDDVLISASHTHSSYGSLAQPTGALALDALFIACCGPFRRDFFDEVVGKFEGALADAIKDLRPAALGVGSGDVKGFNRNRGRGGGPVDPEVGVVKVVDVGTGAVRGLYVNLAAHPTMVEGECFDVSADFPGVLQAALERRYPGAVALFSQGAEGDQSPSVPEGTKGDHWARVEAVGLRLAREVERIAEETPCAASLGVTSRMAEVEMPRVEAGSLTDRLRAMGGKRRSLVHSLTLGDALFMGVPGEPCAEIGLDMKAAARALGFRRAFVVGLAEDHLGYFVHASEYGPGREATHDYEKSLNFYGPGVGAFLVEMHTKRLLPRPLAVGAPAARPVSVPVPARGAPEGF